MSRRWPDKHIIGLTGNIATGKTTVLRLAEERAALALDADSFVHDILANDPDAQREVEDAFGASVREPDGAVDRAALASIVFSDDEALRQLEQILHPRVRHLLYRQIGRSAHKVVFIEAIKLLEGGLAQECDEVWVTRCPVETQVQRLMTDRQLDKETALMRVQVQPSQEIKIAAADVIIDTGGSLEMTRTHFNLAWARLQRKLSAQGSAGTSAAEMRASSDDEAPDGRGPQDQGAEGQPTKTTASMTRRPEPRNYDEFGPGISVRRAQPEDTAAMAELISQATHGILAMEPDQLLADFGERGYLIGEQAAEISAIGGWNAENLVATIDCLYVYPPKALRVTGAAILKEIEATANELICEAIIAVPGKLAPAGTRQLMQDRGFQRVDPETLPRPWRLAVESDLSSDMTVMLKVLRDARQVRVRRLKEQDG